MRGNSAGAIVVTGGAGFIGSALIRQLIRETESIVINVDKLTYAGHLESLQECVNSQRYFFENVDICDAGSLERVFKKHQPRAVMHLAAESHVDRSIDGPAEFINTNILGTYTLLEVALRYADGLSGSEKEQFVFHHVSTDEVYGSLGPSGHFTEESPYRPNSPYSATKAAADHLVRAWNRTFGLPTVVTNCSNNYGPYQYPEKFVPVVILNALERKPIPVYGDGSNVRDWLYVDDHVRALRLVLEKGNIGETYNIGGNSEVANLELARMICELVDEMLPSADRRLSTSLVKFVQDRPGHDERYALDTAKLRAELGWEPSEDIGSGLRKTIQWYVANRQWCEYVTKNVHKRQRLGLKARPR